jgi:hypothetical protein
MSNEETAETINELMHLLSKIDDHKLKSDLEDKIIALCDMLKYNLIIDKIKSEKR